MTEQLGGSEPQYFRSDGTPLSYDEWSELRSHPVSSRILMESDLDDRRVVTVWLGMRVPGMHPADPPDEDVFGTAEIIKGAEDRKRIEEVAQWPTQDAALAGHKRFVDWRSVNLDRPLDDWWREHER